MPMTADEVRRARGSRTQEEMATVVGVSERTWRRWETGEQAVPEVSAKLLAMMGEKE